MEPGDKTPEKNWNLLDGKRVGTRVCVGWSGAAGNTGGDMAEGCVVCLVLRRYEAKSTIHAFLYEGMMFLSVRADFLRTGGFCAYHFQMAKDIEQECWPAGGIGLAILCDVLLKETDRSLVAAQANNRVSSLQEFASHKNCIFCSELRDKESRILEVVETVLNQPDFQSILNPGRMCLQHAWSAEAIGEQSEYRMRVLSAVKAFIEQTGPQLKNVISRHDFRESESGNQLDTQSVDRAMKFLASPTTGT
jgi:hypothetical protein